MIAALWWTRAGAQTSLPPLPAPTLPAPAAAAPLPAGPVPSRSLSVEDRLQRLEEQNQRLVEQNQQLSQQLRTITGAISVVPPTTEPSPPGTEPFPVATPAAPALPSPTLPVPAANGTGDVRAPDNAMPASGAVAQPTAGVDPAQCGTCKKPAPDATKAIQSNNHVWGSNLNATATFKDGLYLWLDSPNKDFTMHVGGWMQLDSVFWYQSPILFAPQGANAGPKQGVASGAREKGIGNLQDGTFFRRIRPFVEGTAWETIEYRFILALENNQFSSTGLDEFWAAMKEIPFIGTVRIGHVKNAIGLEGDMTSSSRTMTFMERSAYSESIERNENFVTGIWFNRNYLDERMSSEFTAFRPDQGASSGAFFGDGQYGLQGRLTGLAVYQDEGRHLLHLGLSGGWRSGQSIWPTVGGVTVGSPYNTFQVRARPELRDDVPDGSPSGAQAVPGSDSNRLLDTGTIAAHGSFLMGLELLYILGPFSAQAEYGWDWIDNAEGIVNSGLKFNPALTPHQNYMFNGGYVQLAYTLTGENRAYDKTIGILARNYYGKAGPYRNAWLVRDESGKLNCGLGAWEIAARYSYVNLCDGSGLNRIQGGRLDGLSVALNWYLNSNTNLMVDWVYDRRSDLPAGSFPGYTSGIGAELQFQF